ncbi:MAG: EAL and GGDEF domain-containing protein [Gammaproteobacteria bacterium]
MPKCNTLQELLDADRLQVLFQPIADIRAGTIYGYEALIRGPSDSSLHSPLALFDAARRCDGLSELDHLCRRLAIERFVQLGLPGQLFLNVMPEAMLQPDGPTGRTLGYLASAGLSPDRVVIELTEQSPIRNYELMREAMAHYREMGFSIALDDLGSAYGGLRHWAELRPDFVKIDGHFAQNIHTDDIKRQFVRSMREIGKEFSTRLVVEGIETREEYEAISRLGIELGQGYYLQRPSAQPPRSLPTLASMPKRTSDGRGETARSLLRECEPIAAGMRLPDVVDLFQRDPTLGALAVVQGRHPVGIVRRHQIMEFYARRFVSELNQRKPIRSFMDRNPLIVQESTRLETLSQLVTEQLEENWDRDFIITDDGGRYLGIGTVIDLLRNITNLQIRYARYANPLTQLPGNVPINEHLDDLLSQQVGFVVAYCDLDHFKPYNDYYGYSRGDQVLREVGRLLSECVDLRSDFVGHVGGDDFILVLLNENWQEILLGVIERFAAQVPGFYDHAELEAGCILSTDRQGQQRCFDLLSLSVGAVPVAPGQFGSHHEIAVRASEVKRAAKQNRGNCLFVDRRRDDGHEAASLVLPRMEA